jgi:hypothetical protein
MTPCAAMPPYCEAGHGGLPRAQAMAGPVDSEQFRPTPITCVSGHPEPAVSWHSGLRGGAHARPKATPVHHAAEWRGGMAVRGERVAFWQDADHRGNVSVMRAAW